MIVNGRNVTLRADSNKGRYLMYLVDVSISNLAVDARYTAAINFYSYLLSYDAMIIEYKNFSYYKEFKLLISGLLL
jgi:hypothetical protein